MKISSVEINDHMQHRLGLASCVLKDLDDLVLLVGANGCGKTRLMNSVHWMLLRVREIGYSQLLRLRRRRSEITEKDLDQIAIDDGAFVSAAHRSDRDVFHRLASTLDGLELEFSQTEDHKKSLDAFSSIHQAIRAESYITDDYLENLAVGIPRWASERDMVLVGSPLAYIEDVCARSYWEQKLDSQEIGMYTSHGSAMQSFELLANSLREILGMDLSQVNGLAEIDGRPVRNVSLSRGQQSLLKFAVLTHSGFMQDESVPIFLDEPERYLHPSSAIKLVDSIRSRMPRAQLWIATHSLSLAAHLHALSPRSVWFGEKGKFERSGLVPERVVNGLLGGDEGAKLIADFCSSSHLFAGVSFSIECLIPPGVADFKEGDPQIRQIAQFINARNKQPLRIIDYGAGSGRLLDGLSAAFKDDLRSHVSYFAVERDSESRLICAEHVKKVYGDALVRVFNGANELLRSEIEAADVVVLTNVLHEIDVKDWVEALGEIIGMVSDEGALLIVEDTVLPHGELAHSSGFLVLEAPALCMLLSADSDSPYVVSISSERGGSRLQATAFARCGICPPNVERVMDALRHQLACNVARTLDLRADKSQKPNYKSGRAHAYYTQSIANIFVGLSQLGGSQL